MFIKSVCSLKKSTSVFSEDLRPKFSQAFLNLYLIYIIFEELLGMIFFTILRILLFFLGGRGGGGLVPVNYQNLFI